MMQMGVSMSGTNTNMMREVIGRRKCAISEMEVYLSGMNTNIMRETTERNIYVIIKTGVCPTGRDMRINMTKEATGRRRCIPAAEKACGPGVNTSMM